MIYVIRWILKGILLIFLIPFVLISAITSIIFWDSLYIDNATEFGNCVIQNKKLNDV